MLLMDGPQKQEIWEELWNYLTIQMYLLFHMEKNALSKHVQLLLKGAAPG